LIKQRIEAPGPARVAVFRSDIYHHQGTVNLMNRGRANARGLG
jgi:hypothetical protein